MLFLAPYACHHILEFWRETLQMFDPSPSSPMSRSLIFRELILPPSVLMSFSRKSLRRIYAMVLALSGILSSSIFFASRSMFSCIMFYSICAIVESRLSSAPRVAPRTPYESSCLRYAFLARSVSSWSDTPLPLPIGLDPTPLPFFFGCSVSQSISSSAS